MRDPIRFPLLLALPLACGFLAACGVGNVSRGIASNGVQAEALQWPDPESTPAMHKGGTFPDPSELRLIKSGITKHQIMELIGPPHFDESFAGVYEWDYLFNFRTPESEQVVKCQYKILFDDYKMARSFYWRDPACARFVEPPVPPTPVPPTPPPPVADKTFTLSSDALFAFGKSDAGSIKSGGKEQLDDLVAQIKAAGDGVEHIVIVGYTDRIGSDAYNDALSRKRAQTVLDYLVRRGVPAGKLQAEGRGKADQVVSCDDNHERTALIACLAPNRRVEVRVAAPSSE